MNFYLANGDQKIGPYSKEQIEIFLKQGLIITTDHVWAEGWPAWMPIENVPGLAPVQPLEQTTPSATTAQSPIEQLEHYPVNGSIEVVRRTIPLNFCILLSILLPLYSILSFTVTQALVSNVMLQGMANKLSTMDSSDIADDAAAKINQNISQNWFASWLGTFVLVPNSDDLHSAIQQKMDDNITYINLLFYVKILFRVVIIVTFLFLMVKANFFRDIKLARWLRFPLAFPITTLFLLLIIGSSLIWFLLLMDTDPSDSHYAANWNQGIDFITVPLGFFVILSAIRYVGMEARNQIINVSR